MKKFTPKTLPITSSRKNVLPAITFTTKGKIAFNQAAVTHFNLNAGSCVSIMQDEEDKKQWHIALDEEGFLLKIEGKQKGAYFSHKQLCEMFFDAFGLKDCASLQGKIAREHEKEVDGLKLYAIMVHISIYGK